MSFSIRTDRSLIRAAARSERYLLARLVAPASATRPARLPVNVALVLDRSGSMAEERKFPLARGAVEQALRLLRAEDRFSLVVYDTQIDVLAASTHATPAAVRRAVDALDAIGPRGGTDLCAGWLRGCEQVAEFLTREAVGRCLLLTDGLANHGTTDAGAIASHAAELRQRGVATSTFGVGADFDEVLLRDLAHEGGGNFYFIESATQIPRIITGDLAEALEVTLRGAALDVVLPDGADAEPLSRFRCRRAHGDNELRVELGDLVSEQEVLAVIKVTFPRGTVGEQLGVRVVLNAGDDLASQGEGEISWTFADHAANDRQPRDREVDREVARLYAAHARAEAADANRVGDFDRARRLLERTARRIRQYAGDDAELNRIAGELEQRMPEFTQGMMARHQLKSVVFEAEMLTKSRGLTGSARRSR